jgi:hypothetical protein
MGVGDAASFAWMPFVRSRLSVSLLILSLSLFWVCDFDLFNVAAVLVAAAGIEVGVDSLAPTNIANKLPGEATTVVVSCVKLRGLFRDDNLFESDMLAFCL